jgi:hypothetical protein
MDQEIKRYALNFAKNAAENGTIVTLEHFVTRLQSCNFFSFSFNPDVLFPGESTKHVYVSSSIISGHHGDTLVLNTDNPEDSLLTTVFPDVLFVHLSEMSTERVEKYYLYYLSRYDYYKMPETGLHPINSYRVLVTFSDVG